MEIFNILKFLLLIYPISCQESLDQTPPTSSIDPPLDLTKNVNIVNSSTNGQLSNIHQMTTQLPIININITSKINIRKDTNIPPTPVGPRFNIGKTAAPDKKSDKPSKTKFQKSKQTVRTVPPVSKHPYQPKQEPEREPLPVPILPSSYQLSVKVHDQNDNEHFYVSEKESEGRGRHELTSPGLNLTCIFNTVNAEGYQVEGVKCSNYSGLPHKCFFYKSKFFRSYVAVGALLQFLRKYNATTIRQSMGGVEVWTWKASSAHMTIEAAYWAAPEKTHGPQRLSPLYFSVRGAGQTFSLPGGPLNLQYQVNHWSLYSNPTEELVATPPGVFCPAHERKLLPKLANQFSLTMETVIQNLRTIAYERQHYEAGQKLVSFTYRPHLHAEGMYLLAFPVVNDLTSDSYRVIHEFKTGIQYTINEKTSNCSIQGIPLAALDAAPTENQHIRLRHASELISIDPNQFIYKGTRVVRGVLCDVWVVERGERRGQYSTVEVYFSHENWTVEVEVFNKVTQVPIGISSYIADADKPITWKSVSHTFFYEYQDGHPSWREFDISPCLNRINRLFLIISLEVSYADIVHYNIESTKNSIRSAIAGIAGVSPLRITDLFLTNHVSTGEVDVWFVLLEKPNIHGPVYSPRPQLPMADAYMLLHDITHKHNVSVKLDLSPSKQLFVTIKRGSLETTTEALHPHMRHKTIRYLKAGYTAGSMAGLGFSMAILGTCVGIFVGFLLWKRNTGVPYQVTD